MSADDTLLGLGLVLCVAVASQLAARRLGLPAIVVLLPAGFAAGAATSTVHPDQLLGDLYQPFVSLAVGVILFEAGLRLSFAEVPPRVRAVVARLVAAGVLVTWAAVAATALVLFDVSGGVALVIGAVLVVSGPTVVMPLLAFIRPAGDVRAVLKWEGVLVDPVGALVGVLTFHAVISGSSAGETWQHGEMAISIGAGAAVGAVGAGALLLLLREVQHNQPRQAVPATLMVVVAVVVAADLLRDDAGFVAATLMGIVLGNQRRIDVSLMLEFHETLVQLLVGVLFVLIAASVSPDDVRSVLPEALALVAVMALVIRPTAALLATWRSTLPRHQSAFAGWMAPRGIVAGATASAFGLQLEEAEVAGAELILPVVFVAVFGTVVLYGLTGGPFARMLGVAGGGRDLVLVVGGHGPARAIAAALDRAGVDVRLWAGEAGDQAAARAAGLDAGHGRLMVDTVSREAELEEVSDVLLLSASDDVNTMSAAHLRRELGHGHVFRLAPGPGRGDLLPPSDEGGILGSGGLTFAELERRFAAGARLVVHAAGDGGRDANRDPDGLTLFTVGPGGEIRVAADGRRPPRDPADTVIVLADPSSPRLDDDPRRGRRHDPPGTTTTT